jgi:hypothetical protein
LLKKPISVPLFLLQYFGYLGNEEVDYINNLPEEARMVEITSNIWGTKFKIQGLHTSLPPLLGQVDRGATQIFSSTPGQVDPGATPISSLTTGPGRSRGCTHLFLDYWAR